jgi:hypothetical protein
MWIWIDVFKWKQKWWNSWYNITKQTIEEDNKPWMDDITFWKIEANLEAFKKKFWNEYTALKYLRNNYKIATKYSDKIKQFF